MFAVLILPFLREIAGATFFHHYENTDQKLICNRSSSQGSTGWWFGDTSLQQFRQQRNDPTPRGRLCDEKDPCFTEGNEYEFKFTHGGIVACKNLMNNETLNQVPVFTNEEDCRNFDFFIVAITQSKTEKKTYSMNPSPQKTVFAEQNNFSLPCQFELKKDTTTFAVYWIKETDWSTCLFSASNEDYHNYHNFSYDINCCVDPGIKGRRLNHSTAFYANEQNQSHELTIVNVTSSDSGTYLCIVGAFAPQLAWMIVTNVSVKVQKNPLASSGFRHVLELSMGMIGCLFLLSGITLFLCWKKKSRGKPSDLHQRDQSMTEVEGDDCSPYAISSRSDVGGKEVIYSLAMSPGVNPNTVTSSLEGKPALGEHPEENLQAIYAVVNKNCC